MAEVTRHIGLSLGADICWPLCFEAIMKELDLRIPHEGDTVRFEVERAESMLIEGSALVGELHGWARLAVAGFVAGGRGAATALRRGGWSVLPTHPPRRRRDVALALVSQWARAGLNNRGERT